MSNAVFSQEEWPQVCRTLKDLVGEPSFTRWIKPLYVYKHDAGTVTLCAPNAHIRDCVISHYRNTICHIWHSQFPHTQDIKVINANTHPQIDTNINDLVNNHSLLNKKYTLDNFVVGPSNELVFAAISRIAEDPFNINPTTNPLFIHGNVGLGKTHLLHALCWALNEKHPSCQFLYMSGERFMHHFVSAIRGKSTPEFRKTLRSVDTLIIDDIQFMVGKESTQEEFFHTFNNLIEQKKRVIIAGDKAPSELGLSERIRSRLGSGITTHVSPSNYDLRFKILQSKARLIGAYVPDEALMLLAKKITSSIRELEGGLNSIVAFSTLIGKPISMDIVDEALHDLFQTQVHPISITRVQEVVSEFFNISVDDMLSQRRTRNIARPRQIAMFLSRELTQSSSTEIGTSFSGKDHTTVVHAVKAVHKLMQDDPNVAEAVANLKKILQK